VWLLAKFGLHLFPPRSALSIQVHKLCRYGLIAGNWSEPIPCLALARHDLRLVRPVVVRAS
jgi:hypothetical protein